MQHARDVMEPALVVAPTLSLTELAAELLASGVEEACVVDEAERLVGVVTGMDLVYREKKVHPPMTIAVLDLVFQLGARKTEQEVRKMVATTVSELMTADVITAGPDTPVDELATRMVDQHLSMIPIVQDRRLIGVVTRRTMLAAALRHLLQVHRSAPAS